MTDVAILAPLVLLMALTTLAAILMPQILPVLVVNFCAGYLLT